MYHHVDVTEACNFHQQRELGLPLLDVGHHEVPVPEGADAAGLPEEPRRRQRAELGLVLHLDDLDAVVGDVHEADDSGLRVDRDSAGLDGALEQHPLRAAVDAVEDLQAPVVELGDDQRSAAVGEEAQVDRTFELPLFVAELVVAPLPNRLDELQARGA